MKLVFHRFRPWALFSVHRLLLALWERQSCTGEAGCENPRYPMRDLLQNFGMGFPEITSIITMCLLVVTFYCNTCIGIYREMYFIVIGMGSRIKTISTLIRAFEDESELRWTLTRHAKSIIKL